MMSSLLEEDDSPLPRLKKQRSFGSFEDLKSEARRVVDVIENGSERDALDVLDVGLEIAGESLELEAVEAAEATSTGEPAESTSPRNQPFDAPAGLLGILYFVKDFITDKVSRNMDFTLGDLHLMMAHEFQTREDLKALAAHLVQVKNEEFKPNLNPIPTKFIDPLPEDAVKSTSLSDPLVVFCDGTGDHYEKETPTNVKTLHSLCVNAFPQWTDRFLYIQGIGVGNQLDHIFAFSLPEKIKEVYFALCERYTPSKELVVFGFSRGAFVARAVCGLLHSCGVLTQTTEGVDEATRRARCDMIVDYFLMKNKQREVAKEAQRLKALASGDSVENTEQVVELDIPLNADEKLHRNVKIDFLGLYDTVPGIPLQQQRLFHHSTRDFDASVATTCHILAANTCFLFESISLHDHRYNVSLEQQPTSWESADEVRKFLHTNRHIEFAMPGDHTNIGGGRISESARAASPYIANMSLRRMLLASPFHAIVSALDQKTDSILFPIPADEKALLADVQSKLDYRTGLSPLEQIQVIAMNMVELLCIDKKVPFIKVGESRNNDMLLNAEEKKALREQIHKNLDRFHVTGELLKFLKALLNR